MYADQRSQENPQQRRISSVRLLRHYTAVVATLTSAGGKLAITTKLIRPSRLPRSLTRETSCSVREVPRNASRDSSPARPGQGIDRLRTRNVSFAYNIATTDPETPMCKDGYDGHVQLSASYLSQHNTIHSKPPPPLEWIVVRIEVTDTGCGIRRKDMVQSKLFCKS